MLEKPDLDDQLILRRFHEEYGLQAVQAAFLPLGYDVNTAVYRLLTREGAAYFLKLRKGAFDEISLAVPRFLQAQGIRSILAPLETGEGRLWGSLNEYKMILYPYIDGQNGYAQALSDRQWMDFGAALKDVHTAALPRELARRIPKEMYSPQWRESVTAFQAQAAGAQFDDPVAAKLAAFMRARQAEIGTVVERAGQLGCALHSRSLDYVLCHSDVHAGNLLLAASGELFIVDWDNPILAPKERDLMFVGMGGVWLVEREANLFYAGYRRDGALEVDRMALAYYRYERVVQDIAAFCEQLFSSDAGGEDREQAYRYFVSNFLPGHEIDVARKTDLRLE